MTDGLGRGDEHHLMETVRQEAQRIYRQFPQGAVELDDLISYGSIAMLEAEARFDASRGVPINAFVRIRVRGAIIDGVRGGLGTFGRRAYRDFKNRLAAERARYQTGEALARQTTTSSTDINYGEVSDYAQTLLGSHPCMPEMDSPEDAYGHAEDIAVLRAAIRELNTGETRIVRAMYDFSLNDNSGAKLARKLGVNRSQICRKHQRILRKLRRKLRLANSATLHD